MVLTRRLGSGLCLVSCIPSESSQRQYIFKLTAQLGILVGFPYFTNTHAVFSILVGISTRGEPSEPQESPWSLSIL